MNLHIQLCILQLQYIFGISMHKIFNFRFSCLAFSIFVFGILFSIYCKFDTSRSTFCYFDILLSMFCLFDILSFRYIAFDILPRLYCIIWIFCFRYFVRWYFTYSISCGSILCISGILRLDILKLDILHFRHNTPSIFCDFDVLSLDILRSTFLDLIFFHVSLTLDPACPKRHLAPGVPDSACKTIMLNKWTDGPVRWFSRNKWSAPCFEIIFWEQCRSWFSLFEIFVYLLLFLPRPFC